MQRIEKILANYPLPSFRDSFSLDVVMFPSLKRSTKTAADYVGMWLVVRPTQATNLIPEALPCHQSSRFGSERGGSTG